MNKIIYIKTNLRLIIKLNLNNIIIKNLAL